MKKSAIKFFDKIILMLLGLTGFFAGCTKSSTDCAFYPPAEPGGNIPDYGMPFSEIRGIVTDKSNSQPIPNIKVVRTFDAHDTDGNTVYTTSRGEYSFIMAEGYLKFEDIDGEDNGGHFATKKVHIKITKEDKEKSRECDQEGGVFVKVQDVKL